MQAKITFANKLTRIQAMEQVYLHHQCLIYGIGLHRIREAGLSTVGCMTRGAFAFRYAGAVDSTQSKILYSWQLYFCRRTIINTSGSGIHKRQSTWWMSLMKLIQREETNLVEVSDGIVTVLKQYMQLNTYEHDKCQINVEKLFRLQYA